MSDVVNSQEKKSTKAWPSILLVEDDPADAMIIEKQVKLVWSSSDVEAVSSLTKAYEASKEKNVDMFLLDLNLPDSIGAKSVEAIRFFDKETPIFVVTGSKGKGILQAAMSAGANYAMSKASLTDDSFKKALLEQFKQ